MANLPFRLNCREKLGELKKKGDKKHELQAKRHVEKWQFVGPLFHHPSLH